jgi:hypothetical protein
VGVPASVTIDDEGRVTVTVDLTELDLAVRDSVEDGVTGNVDPDDLERDVASIGAAQDQAAFTVRYDGQEGE